MQNWTKKSQWNCEAVKSERSQTCSGECVGGDRSGLKGQTEPICHQCFRCDLTTAEMEICHRPSNRHEGELISIYLRARAHTRTPIGQHQSKHDSSGPVGDSEFAKRHTRGCHRSAVHPPPVFILAAEQFELYIPGRLTTLGCGRRMFQSLTKEEKKQQKKRSISSQQSTWHIEARKDLFMCLSSQSPGCLFTVEPLNMKAITNKVLEFMDPWTSWSVCSIRSRFIASRCSDKQQICFLAALTEVIFAHGTLWSINRLSSAAMMNEQESNFTHELGAKNNSGRNALTRVPLVA